MNKTRQITKNDYYKLPIWFLMAIESSIRKNSKYALNKKDIKNKWYIVLTFGIFKVKIPFKALLHSNDKIKGILGIDFNNATYCQGFLTKQCQICDKNLCYANVFELQYIKSIRINKGANNGFLKFNAYYKGFLLRACFKELYNDFDLYCRFIEYIGSLNKVIRFNVNSDFNNLNDCLLILNIAIECPNTVIYGYTTRDDLLSQLKGYKAPNLYVNGSNKMYTNKYKVTFSLETYFKALYKCFGSCNDCKKCFKLKNKVITTLFHNSRADSILNTFDNRAFIIKLVNALDTTLNLTDNDLKVNKGIFSSLNKFLMANGCDDLKTIDIKGIKGFLDYISDMSRSEILECDNINKEVLKEYGLI